MKDAIAEATVQAMEANTGVFCMGEGVDDPGGIFGTTKLPHQRFGNDRVFDTPMSENALTGMAVGAAIMGTRPLLVHARCDFLLLTLDQIVNHAAKWPFMSAGLTAPIVVRAVVGRGWGQGAQHSQSLQATLAHFPDVNVIMPATASDAKGLLLEALLHATAPTVFIEHRWLHEKSDEVATEPYFIPFGSARIDREGTDVTLICCSQMILEARTAADTLAAEGIRAEIVDLRSIRPWDHELVLSSVKKTGRAIICDTSWTSFGISAEIAATISEALFGHLFCPVARIGLPPTPTPCAPGLEATYYPTHTNIAQKARVLVKNVPSETDNESFIRSHDRQFTGHF